MGYYQIINTTSNIVENITEWDGNTSNWQPESGFIAVETTESSGELSVGIGWKYNSGGTGVGVTSGETGKKWIPQIGYGTTV